jgi:long-chain acyl-CoA synthetase
VNLAQLLVRAARVHPDRPALLHGDRLVWRYGELAGRVARLAGHLRALGLAPGDRVALLMKNHLSYLEALYAAWWAGLAAVPINAKLHPGEVDYILRNSETSALFVTDDLAESIAPLAAGLRAALVPGTPAYETALAAAPIEPRRARRPISPGSSTRRDDRAAEGRDADPPQSGDRARVLLHRRRRRRSC